SRTQRAAQPAARRTGRRHRCRNQRPGQRDHDVRHGRTPLMTTSETGPGHRAAPAPGWPAARRRALRLAAGMALLALIAAGCSSAQAGSPASGGTSSAGTTDVSQVTLHVGDQAGSGAEALLTAAGLIGKLPFK